MNATNKKLFARLARQIQEFAEASRADEMKGGGDPDSIPVVEAELELARAKLNECLTALQREL